MQRHTNTPALMPPARLLRSKQVPRRFVFPDRGYAALCRHVTPPESRPCVEAEAHVELSLVRRASIADPRQNPATDGLTTAHPRLYRQANSPRAITSAAFCEPGRNEHGLLGVREGHSISLAGVGGGGPVHCCSRPGLLYGLKHMNPHGSRGHAGELARRRSEQQWGVRRGAQCMRCGRVYAALVDSDRGLGYHVVRW